MNPLTGLFGAGVGLRNRLFDLEILSSDRLHKPVISVGNLSVGGSGKTPFVIALGELLAQRDIQYAVLSRGYRRKTRGVRIVEPDGTPAEFGDEPLLIARRLKIPVIVGESRYQAGRLAEKKFGPQLHILDDGFQHRSLRRDFDIVLLAKDDLMGRLLPGGRLREPLSSLKRADAIVLPRDISADHAVLAGKPIWRIQRELVLPAMASNPIAFCGIARPRQFFDQLRCAGLSPVGEVVFRDHHSYHRNDIDRLRAMQHERGAGGFVTTEKDAVNLGSLLTELQPVAVAVLRLTLDHPANLIDTILARIAERKPRS
jgi:tetraacyldisaccharide 4'-kinase